MMDAGDFYEYKVAKLGPLTSNIPEPWHPPPELIKERLPLPSEKTPNMNGYQHSILLTGGTSGFGLELAAQLARERPDFLIVVASRSDKGATENIKKQSGTANVEFAALDLSDRDNVRSFAIAWAARDFPPIHALMLNAGRQSAFDYHFTDEGFERTFAIQHVGHALLFAVMRPYLADDARIIITASGSHDPAQKLTGMPHPKYGSAEATAHPKPYEKECFKTQGLERYTTAKLASLLWMYALQRRLTQANQKTGKTWTVFASDPGLMAGTSLFQEAPAPIRAAFKHILPRTLPLARATYHHHVWMASEAAAAFVKLAVGEEGEDVGGKYFEGSKEIQSSEESYEEEKQEEMWKWTLENVPKGEEERRLLGLTDLIE